jgi:DNA-binding beta-propeller fold protein YncE
VLVTVLLVAGVATSHLLPGAGPGAARSLVVRTVTVGPQPAAWFTVDAQSSRAFVSVQGDQTLRVLDAASGALLRTIGGRGGNEVWLAVNSRAGRVYVSNETDATVSVLDGRTGAVVRTTAVAADANGDLSTGPLAVDAQTGRVFMAHFAGATVTVLDPRSGAALRQLSVCQRPGALAVSVRTGHVFAKCNDGVTDMLDEHTGRVLSSTPTQSIYGCMLVDERTNRVFELGFPTVGPPHLDVLDARTGRVVHTIPGIGPQGSMTQASYGQRDCPNVAVDRQTGRVYVALLGPGVVGSTATRSEVAVLDGVTGAVLRRFPVADNPVSLAVDSRTGHVLVASAGKVNSAGLPLGNGTVSVLDGASGQVLRTAAVGVNPAAIVVDEQARRALVLSSATDINGTGLMTNPTGQGTVSTIDLSRL